MKKRNNWTYKNIKKPKWTMLLNLFHWYIKSGRMQAVVKKRKKEEEKKKKSDNKKKTNFIIIIIL